MISVDTITRDLTERATRICFPARTFLSGRRLYPLWMYIVSIVDVYDALVSKRVYKIPYAVEEEERMILAGECGVFSPKIIDCFEAAKLELFQLTEGKFKFLEE